MDGKLLARTAPTDALPLAGAAIVLSMVAHPAMAAFNNTDTVTYSTVVVATPGNATNIVAAAGSVELGDADDQLARRESLRRRVRQ